MATLRTAIPGAGFRFHARQLQQQRWIIPRISSQRQRHASSSTTATPPPPPKPRVLEQPDKFRPPSHPARIRRAPRYTGPPLSAGEKEAQKTRRYPHMMPPEGTFMHWFLTNRSVHVWISMGVLCSLVLGVWLEDFVHNTPYREMLPPNSMVFAHPFRFVARWWEVYDLHVAYVSSKTAEMRKQKVDDVQKRSEYRKAHGLEQADSEAFGGWTAKTDEETVHPTVHLRDDAAKAAGAAASASLDAVEATVVGESAEHDTYLDFEGETQPGKKKWFGLW